MEKHKKAHTKIINLQWRIWVTTWIILYIKYLRLFWLYFKKHDENFDNPSIRIHVNKIENRITFKIKTGHYLELLTPEAKIINLLDNTLNQLSKFRTKNWIEIND